MPKAVSDLISQPKDKADPRFSVAKFTDKTILNRYNVYVNWLTVGGIELTKGKQTYVLGVSSTACEGLDFVHGGECKTLKSVDLGAAAGSMKYSFVEKKGDAIPAECKFYLTNSGITKDVLTLKVGVPGTDKGGKKEALAGTVDYVKTEKVSDAKKHEYSLKMYTLGGV